MIVDLVNGILKHLPGFLCRQGAHMLTGTQEQEQKVRTLCLADSATRALTSVAWIHFHWVLEGFYFELHSHTHKLKRFLHSGDSR